MWFSATPCGGDAERERGAEPFAAARLAPGDLKAFVHIEAAAEMRRELADRPIARWLNGLIESGQVQRAWSNLAKAAEIPEAELFDLCLGRSCTLLVRDERQWAVIAEVDESLQTRLIRKLNVRVLEPRAGLAVSELPEHEMLLARHGRSLVIGPLKHASLFYEVLPRLSVENGKAANGDASFSPAAIKLAKSLGRGRIAVFLRHDVPIGGYSMVVADLHDEQLTIRHAAEFENAPFSHGVTKLTCDFSPVELFENRSLLTVVQPTDIGDGPVEAFVAANLGETLLSKQMRANMGERRLIVVGETEGRELEKPVDLLNPTVVCCVQANDAEGAVEQLDRQMVKVAARIENVGKGAFLVQTPNLSRCRRGEPREVDLSGAGDWFTGGFPIMRNLSLNWTVADGPQGAWFVIGTHRPALDEVVAALRVDHRTSPKAMRGKYDSCGSANGLRVGRHLRSWCDQAEHFAQPGRHEEMRATLRMMSDLASGMQVCRWQLARPTPNEMRLDIQIKLAPPESAAGE